MGVVTKEQLAGMGYEDFIQIFGNVIEHCALCSAGIWAKRPFHNLKELHSAICSFIDDLPKIGIHKLRVSPMPKMERLARKTVSSIVSYLKAVCYAT